MKNLILAAALCLALAGCGEDKATGNGGGDASRPSNPGGMPMGMPTGMAPGMPGSMPTGVPGPDMLNQQGTVELTDDMMQRYVDLVKELGSVGNAPSAALLARHKFDLQQWIALNRVIGVSMARGAVSGMRPQLEKQLAELEARRGGATDAEKRLIDARIEGVQTELKSLGEAAGASEIDRRNMEVFERWRERVQAAGR